jgi:hypothetical protein
MASSGADGAFWKELNVIEAIRGTLAHPGEGSNRLTYPARVH